MVNLPRPEVVNLIGASNTEAIEEYNKAINIDPEYYLAINCRGLAYDKLQEYLLAIEDFSRVIQFDPDFAGTYSRRGSVYASLNQYQKAIEDYTKAIEKKPNSVIAYNNRGNVFYNLRDFDKALKDYSRASEIDPNYPTAYYNSGLAYLNLGTYDKAIENFSKAISLDSRYTEAYLLRGITFKRTKDFDKALADFTKAIEIDPINENAYNNRADLYLALNDYDKASSDYEVLISLTENKYLNELAQSKIKEIKRKKEDTDYSEVNDIVNRIKDILLFDEECLTHYTSLSVAKLLILNGSLFRLSEGSYLNDTSEGKELFDYLSFPSNLKNHSTTVPEIFTEKPFIGSFVSQKKHDDLTLWRMYGKEAETEAKGCAITINRNDFLDKLRSLITPVHKKANEVADSDSLFTFYRVTYRNVAKANSNFIIPGASPADEEKLNTCMNELQEKIRNIGTRKLKGLKGLRIRRLLNEVAYLFKSSEYQYEYEVRLVISGIGFEKAIAEDSVPPRVYIQLVNIVPVIHRITLGPKVERADEWASAFNYSLKSKGCEAEIIISHLPFK